MERPPAADLHRVRRYQALPRTAAQGGGFAEPSRRPAHQDPPGRRQPGPRGNQAGFQRRPRAHPLRILIATDAAREGLNLQNHCADLFHFDLPWNPSRMEQRNGRIDRKLQRADVVRCHYFIFTQRPEDRVLEVLLKKTETIFKELGSLTPVLERRLSHLQERGIKRRAADATIKEIEAEDPATAERRTSAEELEETRERGGRLDRQLKELESIYENSKREPRFRSSAVPPGSFRVAADARRAPAATARTDEDAAKAPGAMGVPGAGPARRRRPDLGRYARRSADSARQGSEVVGVAA